MRLALLSDIHEDVESLRQAVDFSERLGATHLICLGDIVGYSVPYYGFMDRRSANAVVDIIRADFSMTVVGNHDMHAVKRLPSYLNDELGGAQQWYTFDLEERERLGDGRFFSYDRNELNPNLNARNRAFLEDLPEVAIFQRDSVSVHLSHYALPDPVGFLTKEVDNHTEISTQISGAASHGCNVSFSGNDHLPGFRKITNDETIFVQMGELDLVEGSAWITGPAVAQGTTPNGFLLYDSIDSSVLCVPLNGAIHSTPENY